MLLRSGQVAQRLGVSVSVVNYWRKRGTGPPYIKVAEQYRYDADALEQWLAAQQTPNGTKQEDHK